MISRTISSVRNATELLSGWLSGGFILSAGVISAVTGIAKVVASFGKARALAVVDPIFTVKFGHLFLGVGLSEILVAAVCFFGRRPFLANALVAWLATSFAVYRLGLWWMDWKAPCGCLGHLTDALHIPPETADSIMKGVLVYLLLGSYGAIWAQVRGTASNKNEKVGDQTDQRPCSKKPGMTKVNESKVLALAGAMVGLSLSLDVHAQCISVQGHYNVSRTSPAGQWEMRATFMLIRGDRLCQICATNEANPSDWEVVCYDGTNTYVLRPIGDNLPNRPKGAAFCGLVMPGRQYYMVNSSAVRSWIPWITYCLPPQDVNSNTPIIMLAWK